MNRSPVRTKPSRSRLIRVGRYHLPSSRNISIPQPPKTIINQPLPDQQLPVQTLPIKPPPEIISSPRISKGIVNIGEDLILGNHLDHSIFVGKGHKIMDKNEQLFIFGLDHEVGKGCRQIALIGSSIKTANQIYNSVGIGNNGMLLNGGELLMATSCSPMFTEGQNGIKQHSTLILTAKLEGGAKDYLLNTNVLSKFEQQYIKLPSPNCCAAITLEYLGRGIGKIASGVGRNVIIVDAKGSSRWQQKEFTLDSFYADLETPLFEGINGEQQTFSIQITNQEKSGIIELLVKMTMLVIGDMG
jgi:hypothetical protein